MLNNSYSRVFTLYLEPQILIHTSASLRFIFSLDNLVSLIEQHIHVKLGLIECFFLLEYHLVFVVLSRRD